MQQFLFWLIMFYDPFKKYLLHVSLSTMWIYSLRCVEIPFKIVTMNFVCLNNV